MSLLKDKRFIQLLITFVVILTALGAINLFVFLERSDRLTRLFDQGRPAKINIIKITDKDCADCFDIEKILNKIRSTNVKIKNEQTLDRQDFRAQKLISQYNIPRLPVFLVFGDLNKNNDLIALWKIFGDQRDSGKTFLLTKVFPPYVEAANGAIRGRFSLIYLTDVSCTRCYDVLRHEVALTNLGLTITPDNSKALDIKTAEGKEVVKKYKIKHVPTIILGGDLGAYAAFTQVWPTVGTIDEDGSYVFREAGEKNMGVYKELTSGKILDK